MNKIQPLQILEGVLQFFALAANMAELVQGLPVLRVIVTHMHPDHIGLAHWLTARWSGPGRECRLWISTGDWNAACNAATF